MERTELIFRGTNLPICPKCGNGNAMLDKVGWTGERYMVTYYCRDCGFEVIDTAAVLVYTELDKKNMGNMSTYTEVRRVNADHRRG